MLAVLANRTYRHLFIAQSLSLLGSGLATVALALLAFALAGDEAGLVLGTALTIKMVVYVALSPLAAPLAAIIPRRALLISLDAVRAGVACGLPFVTEVWQVYALILVLQAGSSLFTPTFQATIPDVLPDEDDYTKALSLSRLAYDLENLLSPALAAFLLLFVPFSTLFAGTAIGFIASGLLVWTTALPTLPRKQVTAAFRSIGLGMNIFLQTPRLRGLLAINMAVAGTGAIVIVNTVVYTQSALGLDENATVSAMVAFGLGSMIAALTVPRLLTTISDRTLMMTGSTLLGLGMAVLSIGPSFSMLLVLWLLLGAASSLTQTPIGRILRRSSLADDRPALFAAQFAASHLCWLVAYPIVGYLGASADLAYAAMCASGVTLISAIAAALLWPSDDPVVIEHSHPELPDDHPHLRCGDKIKRHRHAHTYVVDELHNGWPIQRTW